MISRTSEVELPWRAASFRSLLTFDKPAGRDRDPNARPEATIAPSLAVRKSQGKQRRNGADGTSEIPMDPEEEISMTFGHHEFFSALQHFQHVLFCCCCGKKWPFQGYIQYSVVFLVYYSFSIEL